MSKFPFSAPFTTSTQTGNLLQKTVASTTSCSFDDMYITGGWAASDPVGGATQYSSIDKFSFASENPTVLGKYGEKINFSGNRSWSSGAMSAEKFSRRNSRRLVVPSKYAKKLDFTAVPYDDTRYLDAIKKLEQDYINKGGTGSPLAGATETEGQPAAA